MRLQYCSDLHLEFKENKEFLLRNPIEPRADILLLAGDIVPLAILKDHNWFFDDLSVKFKKVIWIGGNHEFYNSDLKDYSGSFKIPVRKNIFFVNNEEFVFEDVHLIGSTLWGQISKSNASQVEHSVTDFYSIKKNGKKFLPADFNLRHKEDLNFIKNTLLKNSGKKNVVFTHHVPSYKNYIVPEILKGIDEAFLVDLDKFIESSEATAWIYGHHHYNAPEFKIGNCRMLTNQLGYVRHQPVQTFDNSRILDI
ncbi:MAG: metallophosphoesterase [Flavobacteriales bacterium]|nr:metallophosphoesterase [Flavobacteriales bacterium]